MVWRRLALVWLFGMCVTATAAAAPSLRDAIDGEARQAFDDGTRLYKDARYEEAAERFRAAYRASGDRRLLFNVAVCEKAVGRNVRAIHELEESLAERPKLPPEYIERTEEALAALRTHVATVTVETSVPDAVVRVDGQPASAGMLLVDEGPHVLTAEKPDYETASERIEARGGERSRVRLVLVPERPPPRPAHLHVRSDRSEDTIAIDGSARGLGPVDAELPPGEHQVVIARPGGSSKTMSILLREGEARDLRVSLPEEQKGGISPWWFVAGGAILAGAATTTILLATQPTKFEGSTAGTLNPYVVTAGFRGGLR